MKSLEKWCIENNEHKVLELYNNAENEKKSNEVPYSGTVKVNWKCNKCGIQWSQTTNKMAQRPKKDCPFCALRKPSYFYNLALLYPDLEKQWHYEKNKNLTPNKVLPNSSKKVWWKCNNGHVWQAVICDRTTSTDTNLKLNKPICPYCNHKKPSSTYNLLTEYPSIARQWNYLKNGNLKPTDVSPKSQRKVWWVCDFNPNHMWQDVISNRTALNRECVICSKEFTISFPARALFYYLKQIFNDCEMEYRIFSKYILDLYIPSVKIAIEYDGWYFHSDTSSKVRENKKDSLLQDNGIEVIRIKEQKDELENIEIKNNIIKYHLGENYKNLNKLIKKVLENVKNKTCRECEIKVDIQKDHQNIENLYYHIRKANTLAVKYPNLVIEWSNNNEFYPDTIRTYSQYKAKWICLKCNREYVATVNNKVKKNSNCPFCSNRKVTEENSLHTNFPEIAKEWNYAKNEELTPKDVTYGSDKKVWWRCTKGHEWEMRVYIRTGKSKGGCPYCSHRKLTVENSLKTRNPEICKIWNQDKNKGKLPEDYSYSSNVVVWWRCEKGHEWKESINRLQRIKSETKCPHCRGTKLSQDNSLAVKNIKLSKEWHYEKNKNLTPNKVLPNSSKKVWWKCNKGHVWQAPINVRNKGTGCPYCAGVKLCIENSFLVNESELSKEWNYERNKDLTPDKVSKGSNKKVWWRCTKGHEWQDTTSHRKEGRRCPYCYGRKKKYANIENTGVL